MLEAMFERFTPEARRAVVSAHATATEFKHDVVGNEHLLLGLMATSDEDSQDPAAAAMAAAGLTAAFIRERLLQLQETGDFLHSDLSSLGPDVRETLHLALRETLAIGHDHIGTGHLLLGVLDCGEGVSAQILQDAGIEPAVLYRLVMENLNVSKPPRGPRRWRRRGGWRPTSP